MDSKQLTLRFPLWLWSSLLAILLRLPLLDSSFWLDEAAQALESSRPWSQQFLLADDFQPPLFHLWIYLWQQWSHAEWWLRLGSVVPGVISVGIFTYVAERLFGRRAAFLTGSLLATSSLHIFFSQELRPYMFAVGWVSVAMLAFSRLTYDRSEAAQKRFWIVVFTLANAAALLSSYVTIFLLPAWLVVTVLFWRDRSLTVIKSLALSGVFFLAWLPGLLSQLSAASQLREALPGWDQVVSLPQAKALALTLGKFVSGRLPIDPVPRDLVLIGLPLLLLAGLSLLHLWKKRSASLLPFVCIFSLPLLLSWLFSFWMPVVEPKRLLYLLPFLFLLVGAVSTRFRWAWGVAVLWLGIQIWGTVSYWQQPLLQREAWREAVHLIEENYQPTNTVVVFGFPAPFAPWHWYQTEDMPTISTGITPLADTNQAMIVLEGVEQYENVIVFDYLRDLTDPDKRIEQSLIQKGYREVSVWDYPNIGFIRLFYRQALFAYSR